MRRLDFLVDDSTITSRELVTQEMLIFTTYQEVAQWHNGSQKERLLGIILVESVATQPVWGSMWTDDRSLSTNQLKGLWF